MTDLIEVEIVAVCDVQSDPGMNAITLRSSEPLDRISGSYLSHYRLTYKPNTYYVSTGGKTILPGPALLEVGTGYYDAILYRGVPTKSVTQTEPSDMDKVKSSVKILQEEVAELKRQVSMLTGHLINRIQQ